VTNLRIRLARREEWEDVRELRLRALADAPDAFGSTFETEREHSEREWIEWIEGWEGSTNALYVAEAGEAWVGMAVGSREDDDREAHLYGMWVDPAWRGRGVGASLVDEVLVWAHSWGATSVALGVTETHTGAGAFYEHLGFADAAERHPLREGSDLVVRVLRRRL
jgi:ribosomal protein S18 acetylase RimI-like enzyme